MDDPEPDPNADIDRINYVVDLEREVVNAERLVADAADAADISPVLARELFDYALNVYDCVGMAIADTPPVPENDDLLQRLSDLLDNAMAAAETARRLSGTYKH